MKGPSSGAWAGALGLTLVAAWALAAPAAAVVANLTHISDGHGDEWATYDAIANGTGAPGGGAPWDLTRLSADDNTTSWFFAVNYTALGPSANSTLVFYLFAASSDNTSAPEPRNLSLTLPAGLRLLYALYLDLNGALPGTSSLWFYDGITWKNRTFGELSVAAARNDSAGFLELSAPRASLPFLQAGSAAAVLFGANGTALDAVPDLAAPGRLGGAAHFFDYSSNPPLAFTALGFSDPGAAQGEEIGIYLELTNWGPKPVSGVSATVFIDGNPLGSREGLSLMGGSGTAVLSFNWTARAGTHNVTATSYPGGASRTITATFSGASALLVVESAEPSPSNPAPGQPFDILVMVRNTGAVDSQPAHILLKESTLVISTVDIPALGPGETANATLRASYDHPGAHLLRVEVDGVHTDGAARVFDVTVASSPGPFGVDPLILAILAVTAAGAAMWFLTPRFLREKPREGPPEP